MKSTLQRLGAILLSILFVAAAARSQDLLEQMKKAGADAVPKYLSPVLAGWSADLNSGFYHSADLHDILGFDVGVKFAVAQIKDEDKTYQFNLPSSITYAGQTLTAGADYVASYAAPTVVGAKGEDIGSKKNIVQIKSFKTIKTGNQELVLYELPGGYDVPAVPLLMPQLNVGLPLGLEVMARFIPSTALGDFGKVNFVGFGLRYDIDQWLPAFPIDIAAHFMTQKFNLKDNNDKDVLSASATSYGLEISKKLLILTLYGGFDLQSSSFTVGAFDGIAATPSGATTFHVNEFTVDGKNSSRFVVGVRLLLLIINVHAEYSVATQPMLTAGVGLTIR